ncbi:hypothetical protein AGDE_14351 [Angomonas deanei]|uniref:Uncharacterized protein n=1 Tax=Angomonas deanei TaxID=59799 RepID=A0A7G2C8U0_9TRYP|nr:hypothetical protein AGDE_14351 [Angomonas deanei]CAD2215855.1 hypothetical protein, conserved [Angomonas deanei]|eukprot:EPY20977.1 hypothetical protein AGDE_14351 [Angomonas deanei]
MSSEAGVKEVDPNETYSSHHSSHHPARKAVWEESSQGTEANCTFQPRVSRGPERVPDDEEDKPAPAPVFSRLYADAQRYNRQRTEREKALELQQQMRNGEIPYDREALVNAGLAIDSDDDFEVQRGDHDGPQNAQRNTAVPGEEPRRRSVNPEVFDRLARPTQVTLKREQQKELEEQRKKEEEEKRAEDRKREMAEVTTYQWELPARSYTMADIHRQNALYVQ